MKRLIGSLLFVAAVLTACADNRGSIQVRGVLLPGMKTNGSCTYDPEPTSPLQFSGTLDIGLNNQYAPALIVQNQMIQRSNTNQLRVETDNVQLEGATVRVTDAVGNQLANYTTTGAGFVYASNGTTPGFGAISITLVDANTIEMLRPTIKAGDVKRVITFTKLFGHTLGGIKLESSEFEYPVDLCLGCLVDKTQAMDCSMASMTSSANAPCVVGQDQSIDCRLCAKYFAVCR